MAITERKPLSCPVCRGENVHGWIRADRFGQNVLFYYECDDCGRQAGFCDEASALELWKTLTEKEHIVRLKKFIRAYVCARCHCREMPNVCEDCVTHEVLNERANSQQHILEGKLIR